MISHLLALTLALQAPAPTTPAQLQPPAPPPPPEQPLRADGPPEVELNPAHDLYWQDAERNAPTRRAAIQRAGACVARASSNFAANVLSRDFTTSAYRNGLNQLVRNNQTCFERRGSLRSDALPFAGALAEQLLERAQEPLNMRLARAASAPAAQSYTAADRIAICLVRSLPDEVARLLATEVGTETETEAARAFAPALAMCSPDRTTIGMSAVGLRSIVAMAAFRQLHQPATLAEARN